MAAAPTPADPNALDPTAPVKKPAVPGVPATATPNPPPVAPTLSPLSSLPQPGQAGGTAAPSAPASAGATSAAPVPYVPPTKPGTQAAPMFGDGNVYLQGLGNVSGGLTATQGAPGALSPTLGAGPSTMPAPLGGPGTLPGGSPIFTEYANRSGAQPTLPGLTPATADPTKLNSWTADQANANGWTGLASDWKGTMSSDPNVVRNINQQIANGIDPNTGKASALNSAVLTKGYTWRGNGDIYDPTTGQTVGNAFTLGQSGVDALPASGRGNIAWNAEDALGYTPPPVPAATAGNAGAVDPASSNPGGPNFNPGYSIPVNGIQPKPADTGLGLTAIHGGVTATPGKVSTVQTQNAGPSANTASPAPSAAPIPFAGPAGSVTQTPYTAGSNLIDQTLSAGPTADRFAIAQQKLDAYRQANQPAFQAKLRDAIRSAAGAGAIGSGMLQSNLGDVVANQQNAENAQGQNFLADALSGSIGDAYNNVGIAQQQQGFQAGRADTAFQQEYAKQQLQEALKSGDFSRALQALLAGSSGNPADTALALSGIYGNQATGAGNAASGLFGNTTYNNATANSNQTYQQMLDAWLRSLTSGGGSAGAPASVNLPSNIPASLPTGQALGGGSGPISPFAVGG